MLTQFTDAYICGTSVCVLRVGGGGELRTDNTMKKNAQQMHADLFGEKHHSGALHKHSKTGAKWVPS